MAGDAFQKVRSSLNRGVAAISVKTSSSLEKAKIKTHIESIRTELQRAVEEAGKAAYSIWESGGGDYSPLDERFSAMKQKYDEIAALEAEYDAIDERSRQIFGASGEEKPADPPEPEGTLHCPSCGAAYSSPAKFCRKCGQKLPE